MNISPDNLSSQLPMFVANFLRDDIESVATLVTLLNDREVGCRIFAGRDFKNDDAVRSLKELVQKQWVEVLMYDPERRELVQGDLLSANWVSDEIWFRLTDLGRDRMAGWIPPINEGKQ